MRSQTLNRVKADVLFSYQPPLNLLAFLVMFPASFVLTPRWFHKVRGPSTLWQTLFATIFLPGQCHDDTVRADGSA